MRCCCGKKDITEPYQVNDYRHEPYGQPGASCGPAYKHELRDLYAEVKMLRAALEKITKIENKCDGGDWDEIEEARRIAYDALSKS